jgi:hypothetical protein
MRLEEGLEAAVQHETTQWPSPVTIDQPLPDQQQFRSAPLTEFAVENKQYVTAP